VQAALVLLAATSCVMVVCAQSPDDAEFKFDYLGGGNSFSPAYRRCQMTHR
jgi:hypothetical protein